MVLVDTNVLARVLQRDHVAHAEAWEAIKRLHFRNQLVLAPQNVVELWVVATRPKTQNGLGMRPSRAALYLTRLNRAFPILPETPRIYQEWQRLVVEHGVSGKKAHDTRLVAAMIVHGVGAIVTFNVDDFRRFPQIEVLHPRDIVGNVAR